MSSKTPRSIKPESGGFFNDLSLRVRLILRLMGDSRVSPLLKLLPLATVVYLFFPDLIPGPIDDAAVIWLGTSIFVELCPQAVVQEHMDDLRRAAPARWKNVADDENTVDAEFREVGPRPGQQGEPPEEHRVR